jgi:hypothetical protein
VAEYLRMTNLQGGQIYFDSQFQNFQAWSPGSTILACGKAEYYGRECIVVQNYAPHTRSKEKGGAKVPIFLLRAHS